MKQVNVRIPEPLYERLSLLAKRTGRSQTFYVKEAIVDQLEDLEDAFLASQRLASPETIFTLEEIEKELGLDN